MPRLLAILLLMALPAMAGCLYVPLLGMPSPGSRNATAKVGLSESDKPLRLGVTDRRQVVRKLGRPKAESLGGACIVYRDDRLYGMWLTPFGVMFNARSTWHELVFNDQDLLIGSNTFFYETPDGGLAMFFVGGDPTEVDLPGEWADRYPGR